MYVIASYSYSVVERTQQKQEMEFTKFYGNAAICIYGIKNWFNTFQKGEFKLDDKPRTDRPKKTEDEELQKLLDEDVTQSTRELARHLNIDHPTVLRHLRAMG